MLYVLVFHASFRLSCTFLIASHNQCCNCKAWTNYEINNARQAQMTQCTVKRASQNFSVFMRQAEALDAFSALPYQRALRPQPQQRRVTPKSSAEGFGAAKGFGGKQSIFEGIVPMSKHMLTERWKCMPQPAEKCQVQPLCSKKATATCRFSNSGHSPSGLGRCHCTEPMESCSLSNARGRCMGGMRAVTFLVEKDRAFRNPGY